MEEFARRALVALTVGVAGSAAAMLALLATGPTLVAASAPATEGGIVETVGSLLVGILLGGILSFVVAYAVGAIATLIALRATRCPRPQLAWIVCLALSPVWIGALSAFELDIAGFLVLCGVLPSAVRLGFDYMLLPSGPSNDLVPLIRVRGEGHDDGLIDGP